MKKKEAKFLNQTQLIPLPRIIKSYIYIWKNFDDSGVVRRASTHPHRPGHLRFYERRPHNLLFIIARQIRKQAQSYRFLVYVYIYSSNWLSHMSGHGLHSIFPVVCEMVECFLHSCVFRIILVASIILANQLNSNIQRFQISEQMAAQFVQRVALPKLLTSLILFVYIWLARDVEIYKVRRKSMYIILLWSKP